LASLSGTVRSLNGNESSNDEELCESLGLADAASIGAGGATPFAGAGFGGDAQWGVPLAHAGGAATSPIVL
jgi:hypothetical protein